MDTALPFFISPSYKVFTYFIVILLEAFAMHSTHPSPNIARRFD